MKMRERENRLFDLQNRLKNINLAIELELLEPVTGFWRDEKVETIKEIMLLLTTDASNG